MGRLGVKSDYEELRNAQILENKARMASLGLQKTVSELRSISSKPQSQKRKYNKVDYLSTPLRRSNRLQGNSPDLALRRSDRLKENSRRTTALAKRKLGLFEEGDDVEKRPANAPLLRVKDGLMLHLTPEALARRCASKDRGSMYDPILGICCHFCRKPSNLEEEDETNRHRNSIMGRLGVKSDYEEIRNAQILENKARFASLGLQKTVAELRSISSKPQSEKRKYNKVDYLSTPLRRSNRLQGNSPDLALRRSDRLKENSRRTTALAKRKLGLFEGGDDVEKRPANAPRLRVKDGLMLHLTPEALARRCASKDRGSIYDPILGICCHFCRQKKLCGEEDCKRCGDLDMDQPCLGKTDCSICHSSNGVLCRGCLKVRYGEEMEDVRANKEWVCPHCTEEKGINPYWICNSSLCLKKRKMAPTGIAIFRAREMGYKSVAHLLMDQLQGAVKGR